MTEDIAPGLLERIQQDFEATFQADAEIQAVYRAIESGTATYAQANEFAVRTGELLAQALGSHLSGDVLPDGRMYYNIAQRILTPTFRRNYELISGVTASVQEALNTAAGLGIKAQTPVFPQDRLDGIIDRVSSEEFFDDVSWILQEPVVNFSQSVVDDAVQSNAEFQTEAGLYAMIVRTLNGLGCPWCRALAGFYEYAEAPRDVFRRHDNCRCTVALETGKGPREIIHSGTEGKRRYVSDGYGGYELTKEARIQRAKEMEATAAERAKTAREKRIATWAKKKQAGWTANQDSAIIETRRSVGMQTGYSTQKFPVNPSTGERYIARPVTITDTQFGKKVGKHAADFGLDPSVQSDRDLLREIITTIVDDADERCYGEWRGQEFPVLFHIKGEDVVVESRDGQFITLLKGGITNARVENARKRTI